MNIRKILLLTLILGSSIYIPSCTTIGIATGVGATIGISAAKEGGIKAALKDTKITATINDKWFKYDLNTFAKLNLTVEQGRVLITGIVPKAENRVEAVKIAWQVEGVEQVINEIIVDKSQGIKGYMNDSWITTQFRTKITLNKDIQSVNYSIDTVSKIIYIMGIAQNQSELDKIIEIARTIKNVSQVISYVKIAGPK